MAVFRNVNMSLCVAALPITVCACIYIYKRFIKSQAIPAKYAFKLDINVASNSEECKPLINELCRRCKSNGYNAIGFDCEWVSQGRRRPVALLQLAAQDGYCVLIRMNLLKDIPSCLRQLLEDKDIYKVGIVPLHDANYLYNDHGVTTRSTIDLRHFSDMCGYKSGSLAHLTEMLLGVVLDKRLKIRCSDWDAHTLSSAQLHYAAADAHASIRIFVKLINKLDTWPQRIACGLSFNKSIWTSLDRVCHRFIDFGYKTINEIKKKPGRKTTEKAVSKRYSNCMRTKPLYDNCFLQAPDGELLCTCDRRKALWYIDKNLADEIESDPLTVRLRFEPAGRSVGLVGQYYQLTKENHCVVCGITDSYIRKNVVPREYRKYFPEIMKDRSSHDVLLLCGRCHQRSNIQDQSLRNLLADTAAAPLQHLLVNVDDTCKKVRMAARALTIHESKLPQERIKELQSVVLSYYTNHSQVTEDLLQEASKLSNPKVNNEDIDSHGQAVVKYFLNEKPNGLLALEELWRSHFLTTMRPQYMPTLWSVKHNEERLRIKWDEGRLSKEELKLIGIEGW